ncbi:MAG: hypothetical protein JO024_09090 [Candidatus Eremiobacteraeota bacterium]|nr:hypothetical protein [Candidatus Eremiobacteraeota bacterium]MBV9736700.1 hypothetical protein [Candidatus Eremiobacteraeota bacterium]
MNVRIVVAIVSATGLLLGNAPLWATAASTVHGVPPVHTLASRSAMPHSSAIRVPSLSGAHASDGDSDDRATPHPSSNARSNVQPQIEAPAGHRLFLPWWFRRRHIAAPLPPLV